MIIENCTFEQNAGITSSNDIPYIPRHLIEKLLYHITVNQSYLSTAVLNYYNDYHLISITVRGINVCQKIHCGGPFTKHNFCEMPAY